jgi:hypothetical protein
MHAQLHSSWTIWRSAPTVSTLSLSLLTTTYISKFAAYELFYLLVTKGELERLKKRFMKLDACVLSRCLYLCHP